MPTDDRCDPRAYPQIAAQMFDALTPDELGRLYSNAQMLGNDLFARFATALIVVKRFDTRYLSPGMLDIIAHVCAVKFAKRIASFRGECRFSSFATWTVRAVCAKSGPYEQQRHPSFDPDRDQGAHSVTQRPASGPHTFDRAWLETTYPKLRRILAEIARRKQRATSEELAGNITPISFAVKFLLFIAHKLNGDPYDELAQRFGLPADFIQKLVNNVTMTLCDAIRRAYERSHPDAPAASNQHLFTWLITDDDDNDDEPPAASIAIPGGRPR